MTVKKGDKVKIEYTGTLTDGTEFDSSKKHGKPLEFTAGEGKVIKGFDAAVIGMKQGEEKDVAIKSDEAYGPKHDQLVQQVPKDQLPEGDVKEGMMLGVTLPDGRQTPATITKVEDDKVTIDFNHPLAGKDLKFHIKVVEIEA